MKGLTAKEEEIMGFFWEKGPLFVKEMLVFYEEPKPHFNTLSTIVRGLDNSYLNAVSSLVKEEDISLDELKQLIHEVEQADKKH